MNEEPFILISLDDPKSKIIADVLNNKTCKRLIFYLTKVNEATEKDFAEALKIPLNTVEYNLKKLIEAGFIQKKQKFFWSKKGKKICIYELTNKTIILSNKKSAFKRLKSIMPSILLSCVGSFFIWVFEKIKINSNIRNSQQLVTPNLYKIQLVTQSEQLFQASNLSNQTTIVQPILWLYFLVGSITSIIIISVLNWRKL